MLRQRAEPDKRRARRRADYGAVRDDQIELPIAVDVRCDQATRRVAGAEEQMLLF